jgi:hypothetical protein
MFWLIVLVIVGGLMFVLFGKKGIHMPPDLRPRSPRPADAEARLDRELDQID